MPRKVAYPPVAFYSRLVEPLLDQRRDADHGGLGRGQVASRDLGRYYLLVDHELRALGLTEPEASLICDALNGTFFEESSVPAIWTEVADAIRLGALDQKWAIDGAALVARLEQLTPGQRFALADAVERFWLDTSVPTAERIAQVGLR